MSYEYPNHVLKLKKSLYGLKQAPLEWYKDISRTLQQLGLKESLRDPCLFTDTDIHVIVYVDDILICSSSNEKIYDLYHHLECMYSLKCLEDCHFLLGIAIEKLSCGSYILHQQAFIKQALERFNMKQPKPASIPIPNAVVCEKSSKEVRPNLPYRELVGSLMYLMLSTRPDIAFGVCLC